MTDPPWWVTADELDERWLDAAARQRRDEIMAAFDQAVRRYPKRQATATGGGR